MVVLLEAYALTALSMEMQLGPIAGVFDAANVNVSLRHFQRILV